jgi:hypothetical protein
MSLGPVNKSRLGGAMGSLANHLGRAAEKLESKGGLREAAKSGARNATEGLAGLSRRSALTASTYAHEKLSSVAGEFSAAAGGALRPALKSVAGMQAGVHRRADNIADRMKNASASIGNAAHQLRSDLNGAAHVAKHEIRQGLHDLKAELKHEAGAFKQGLGNHLHAAASGGGRPQYGTHTEHPTGNDRPPAPYSGGPQGRYDPRPGAGAQGTGGTSRTNEPRANQKPAGSGTPPRAEAKPTGPASHAEEKPVGRAAGLKLMGLSDKATPHDILGVSADASPAEIRKGSLKQLLKFHPDKNNGSAESTEATKLINNAVEALRKA